MKKISIDLACKSDVPAIIDLNREGLKYYRWTYDRDYIRRAVSHGNYYVLCQGRHVMGSIKFYLERNYLWISTMVVGKEFRRQGHGKRLMDFAEEIAKNMSYDKIRLDTLTISRVGKFYEKMGYHMIEEGPYYGRRYRIYEKTMH